MSSLQKPVSLKQREEVVALVLETGPEENPPSKGANGHDGVEQYVIRANCPDHQESPVTKEVPMYQGLAFATAFALAACRPQLQSPLAPFQGNAR